jgi:hypothetical protein
MTARKQFADIDDDITSTSTPTATSILLDKLSQKMVFSFKLIT